MSMNSTERKQTAEAWISACKSNNQHVIVQVGGTNLPDVLDLVSILPNLVVQPKLSSGLGTTC